jgi:hypothetical protein
MPRNRDVWLYDLYPLVHPLVFRAECKGDGSQSGPFGCSPSEDSLFQLRHHLLCSYHKSFWRWSAGFFGEGIVIRAPS